MSKQLTRRNFLKMAGVASAGAALAACAPAQPAATQAPQQPAPADNEPTPTAVPTAFVPSSDAATVDIWLQQVSIDVMKGTAKLFMEKNPDIKVNFIPMAQIDAANNLLAAIAAGAGAPDAAFIDWNIIQRFTARGGVGVRDLKDNIRPKTDWVGWDLDLATTKDGKLIGLPEDLGINMMFYRTDVFEQAGMPSDPENVAKLIDTWDDMIMAGQKMTEPGKRWMLNNASDIWGIVQQEGEIRFFDDGGQPVVNADRYVKAAEISLKARKAGIDAKIDWWSSDWEVARNKVPGVVALYPCAAWWDQIIQPAAPDTKGLWRVVPLPSKASAYGGGSFFVFPDMSKKFESAFKFTSYAEASEEGITEYMKSGKFLPAYRKYYNAPVFTAPDPFYGNQVWLKAFADQVDSIMPMHITINDSIATEVLNDAIKNILDKGADIKPELDKANEEIKKRVAGA
jgi:ABC-type glycerol-3-phosphate transport system substrate-binding protein